MTIARSILLSGPEPVLLQILPIPDVAPLATSQERSICREQIALALQRHRAHIYHAAIGAEALLLCLDPPTPEPAAGLSPLLRDLVQMPARAINRHRQRRGPVWLPRCRTCLLADDSAVLAAMAHLQARTGTPAWMDLPRRSAPLVHLGDGLDLPADLSPLHAAAPVLAAGDALFAAWSATLDTDDLSQYALALGKAHALGRAESLAGPLDRLGRGPGRGRSRRLRQLDDRLGLAAIWG